MVSKRLRNAVKLDDRRGYVIAHEAGVCPSTLSRLINGIEIVRPGDPRVIAIGRVLGIPPDECFESQNTEKERKKYEE